MSNEKVTIGLGAIIIINEKEVPLLPKTSPDGNTWELGLPPGIRVELGTVSQAFDGIMETFDSDYRYDKLEDDIKGNETLAGLVQGLGDAMICIEEAHIKKVKEAQPEPASTSFRLGFSLSWSDPGGAKLVGKVGLKGIYLTIAKEDGAPSTSELKA
jgi:hypothetical protein